MTLSDVSIDRPILTWMMTAATCPGAPGDEIYYEAMP